MKIRKYLDQINNWHGEQSEMKNFDLTELENLILKNALNGSEDYFTLEILFRKTAAEEITVNTEIINLISKRLGLLFFNEEENGNVCFANNAELRSEFRQSFRILDLLDFSLAILHSSIYEEGIVKEKQKIPFPHDADLFWKIVKIGNDFRKKENP
ncbi:hypothetical protein [Flavobacterium mesophilum]|uniref:hypothetical protein n=1 Tax=Flavobacterium mesophilum TaxID=3143495 RepID=UPI0031D48E1C